MPNTIGLGARFTVPYYASTGTDLTAVPQITWTPTTTTLQINGGSAQILRNSNTSLMFFNQHHSTQDTTSFTITRSRGTFTSQLPVQANDVVGKVTFRANTAAGNTVDSGYISNVIETTRSVTAGSLNSRIIFSTRNGSTISGVVAITAAGQLLVNSISNFSGNDLTLSPAGQVVLGDPTKIKITGGTNGQVLSTNGSGGLSWINAGGGGGSLPSRTTVTATTNSLAPNANSTATVTAFKGYSLYKMSVSTATWVRVYNSFQSMVADASRSASTDPLPTAGVLAEVITSRSDTVSFSPGISCYNNDTSVNSKTYLAIKNLSSSTTAINVTMTVLQTEV
jgi:hypothetical protein